MNILIELKANYAFIDTPYDMIYACQTLNNSDSNLYNVTSTLCIVSHILGIISVYIFPITGGFGLLSDIIICYIFVVKYSKKTRQTVLFTFLAISEFSLNVSLGWLWMLPAKGLPYASRGRIYLIIMNISDIACRLYRNIYITCSTWTTSAFLLICCDRLLAIYFPMKMIKFGYRSAVYGSIVTLALSIIFSCVSSGFTRWAKVDSKILCNSEIGYDQKLLDFLRIWRTIFVGSGVVQMSLILLVNVTLVCKIFVYHSQVKALSTNTPKSLRKEIKATSLVLTLSIIFLLGSVPDITIFLSCTYIENNLQNDQSSQDTLQFLYNLADLALHFMFMLGSVNSFIYYSKMKQFRKECHKLIGWKSKNQSTYISSQANEVRPDT